jgi:aminoglycoside phosphotransferase (APT) family kinase protein
MSTPAATAVDWTDPAAVQRAADRLAQWIDSHVEGARDVTVTGLRPPSGSGGFSNLALLVDATWTGPGGPAERELFARVELPGPRLVHTSDLQSEGRLVDALHKAGVVPVPGIVGYEPDPSVLGGPFLLMQRTQGRVMADNPPFTAEGWLLDLDPEAQERHQDAGLQVLANLARFDWQAAGLKFLDRRDGGSGVDDRMDFLTTLLERTATGRNFPFHRTALERLERLRPAEDGPAVLSWGDARVGNLMYAHDAPVVTAVLDWEQATIGSPELDLGWWLFSDRIYTDGFGLPLPPGFHDRAATIDRYEQLSGHTVRHIDFYEAYAGVQIAVIMIGIADRLVAAGAVPTEADMQNNNPVTKALAGLLGLPEPTGATASWAT